MALDSKSVTRITSSIFLPDSIRGTRTKDRASDSPFAEKSCKPTADALTLQANSTREPPSRSNSFSMRPLATELALSTAHRPIRDKLAARVLSHPQDVEEVLRLAFSTREANHHKACWVLVLVLEEKIEWLNRHLELFTQKLALFSDPRGRRSISKICL